MPKDKRSTRVSPLSSTPSLPSSVVKTVTSAAQSLAQSFSKPLSAFREARRRAGLRRITFARTPEGRLRARIDREISWFECVDFRISLKDGVRIFIPKAEIFFAKCRLNLVGLSSDEKGVAAAITEFKQYMSKDKPKAIILQPRRTPPPLVSRRPPQGSGVGKQPQNRLKASTSPLPSPAKPPEKVIPIKQTQEKEQQNKEEASTQKEDEMVPLLWPVVGGAGSTQTERTATQETPAQTEADLKALPKQPTQANSVQKDSASQTEPAVSYADGSTQTEKTDIEVQEPLTQKMPEAKEISDSSTQTYEQKLSKKHEEPAVNKKATAPLGNGQVVASRNKRSTSTRPFDVYSQYKYARNQKIQSAIRRALNHQRRDKKPAAVPKNMDMSGSSALVPYRATQPSPGMNHQEISHILEVSSRNVPDQKAVRAVVITPANAALVQSVASSCLDSTLNSLLWQISDGIEKITKYKSEEIDITNVVQTLDGVFEQLCEKCQTTYDIDKSDLRAGSIVSADLASSAALLLQNIRPLQEKQHKEKFYTFPDKADVTKVLIATKQVVNAYARKHGVPVKNCVVETVAEDVCSGEQIFQIPRSDGSKSLPSPTLIPSVVESTDEETVYGIPRQPPGDSSGGSGTPPSVVTPIGQDEDGDITFSIRRDNAGS